MKQFIIEASQGDYAAVVYTTGYDSFMEHLTEIQNELASMGIVGTILFDTLTAKGNTSTRYRKAQFDGQFDKSSFETVVVAENSPIREESSRFYRTADKEGLLDLTNTLLTYAQALVILRGLTL